MRRPNPELESTTRAMLAAMTREPFHATGLRLFQRTMGIAWVSDASQSSTIGPIWNETRDVCVILNGDLFPDPAILARLKSNRHESRDDDGSYLVHHYEEQGLAAFEGLNGGVCGVLVDARTHEAILFNDRFGLRRIYFHETADAFYFSTEAKALLAVLPKLREVNQRSLAEFMVVGCGLQNRSLFKGVALLPPSSAWCFRADARIRKHCYFQPATWENQPPLSASTYTEQLVHVWSRIVPRYLKGASGVAVSLTGGLDSRLILAWARVARGELPLYTFAGPYRDCADVVLAREAARICQQPHTTIRIDQRFFQDFPSLAEQTVRASDGTMDASGAVELYMNRLARRIAPLRVTGNYGSEILRANIAFRPTRLNRTIFTPEFNRLIDEAVQTYDAEAAGHRLSFIAFKQVPWHHHSRFSIEHSQLTLRSPFLDNELVGLAYRAPRNLAGSPQPLLDLVAQGNPALDALGTDRALRRRPRPVVTRLANTWQEFTAKAEYAYDYGMPLWLVRTDRMLSRLRLERLFLGRHKFYHFRVWYRDQLSSYVREIGTGSITPSCYREGVVRGLVHDHVSGRANHTSELHKLLSMQLIDRLFIRGR